MGREGGREKGRERACIVYEIRVFFCLSGCIYIHTYIENFIPVCLNSLCRERTSFRFTNL